MQLLSALTERFARNLKPGVTFQTPRLVKQRMGEYLTLIVVIEATRNPEDTLWAVENERGERWLARNWWLRTACVRLYKT
jgi:hypothetical protein